MTAIPNPILSSATAYPDRPAVEGNGHTWTWTQLLERCQMVAAWLKFQGIGAGSVIALTGPICTEWIAFCHGAGWVGASVIPIDPSLNEERVGVITAAVGAQLVCNPSSTNWVQMPPAASAPAERFWPLDEVRFIVMTSGTTGTPTPVTLTTAQVVFSALGSALRLGHLPGDRWLNCLPLHHVGGLSIVMRTAFYGTTMRLSQGFDPRSVAESLDSGHVTQVSLVPAMWSEVLGSRRAVPFPASLRTVLIGGARLSDTLRTQGEAIGAPVAESWGMTEAASQVCTRAPDQVSDGVGTPLPFARVASDGGRLVVSGPIVKAPTTTADHGSVSLTGQVNVGGRIDDIIISGGINLSPAAIEAVLLTHPQIIDAVVVAQSHPRWGQRPYALVVASDSSQPPAQAEVQRWLVDRLKRYEMPDGWYWLDSLPRNAMGKISRNQLGSLLQKRRIKQADALQTSREEGGTLDGAKIIERHESMLHLDGAAEVIGPTVTDDFVTESNGTGREALHSGANNQAVRLTNGSTKISLGMNDGRTETPFIKEPIKAAESGNEELLVTRMGVLEDTPKENNSSPVNFVESRSDGDFECHEGALLSQKDI